MAGNTHRDSDGTVPRLGRLPQRYAFFLNPYRDVRFSTSCPGCSGKIRVRKLPLAIHVKDWGMFILNKTCRYCPDCELLIAHQDDLDAMLTAFFDQQSPDVIGNDYLVIGTVERRVWRRGTKEALSTDELRDALRDFKRHCHFEPAPCWQFARGNRSPKELSPFSNQRSL